MVERRRKMGDKELRAKLRAAKAMIEKTQSEKEISSWGNLSNEEKVDNDNKSK